MQPSAAASLLRIKDEDAKEAFRKLAAPDKRSRNKDSDGRRIRQTDHGYWEVVSYGKYQELASRAGAVVRQQRYLERKKKAALAATGVNLCVWPGCREPEVAGKSYCMEHMFVTDEVEPDTVEEEGP